MFSKVIVHNYSISLPIVMQIMDKLTSIKFTLKSSQIHPYQQHVRGAWHLHYVTCFLSK